MKNNEIKLWAEKLQREVYKTWKKKYSFWKQGFKVFYGPVKKRPELMIISHNPGGDHIDFQKEDKPSFEKGNFLPPESLPYSGGYTMSRKMQRFFAKDMYLLETSVTIPIMFFRSKNINKLNDIERFKRYEMERYSLLKVKEIIDTVQPENILVIGLKTYDLLGKVIGLCDEEEFLHMNKDGRLLAVRAKQNGGKIFAMLHISGARINTNELSFIKKSFFKFIKSKS